MSVDRLAQGYEPDFDIDYALGRQGELYVVDIGRALAEGNGRVEVKTDERALQTGRVYIEYACKKFGAYQPSGIATSQSDLWAFVIGGDVLIVAPTWRVREAVNRLGDITFFLAETTRGSHPTRGVVIPLNRLLSELFGGKT